MDWRAVWLSSRQSGELRPQVSPGWQYWTDWQRRVDGTPAGWQNSALDLHPEIVPPAATARPLLTADKGDVSERRLVQSPFANRHAVTASGPNLSRAGCLELRLTFYPNRQYPAAELRSLSTGQSFRRPGLR